MNLKKVITLLLTASMAAGSMMGCGSSAETKTASSVAVPSAAVSTEAAKTTSSTAPAKTAADNKRYDGVTITLLKDSDTVADGIKAVIAAAEKKYGFTIETEDRVGGDEGDNIIKTRLASGEMSDICLYNSGSLLAALNPSEYFEDLSKEDFVSTLDETYLSTVTVDGKVYGVPVSSTQVGAILYYKPDYEKLGLQVPKTWTEFIANCDKLKAAGKTAMIGTFGDSWTSQVMFLGDEYNVEAANSTFPKDFEAGKAKYATTPAATKSFQKLLDVQKYYNKDYLSAKYDDGCDMLPNGEGTHWVMLTQALSNMYSLYPDKMKDIGVFAIPGDSADFNGLTVWEPSSFYVNKNCKNKDAVMAFLKFYVSKEGLDTYASVIKPDGPYCVKGYALPSDAYEAVKNDMQPYFDAGKTGTALEFKTSVKGSSCPAICQEVGSGQISAAEAAKAYDEDCEKQAAQLGLKWK